MARKYSTLYRVSYPYGNQDDGVFGLEILRQILDYLATQNVSLWAYNLSLYNHNEDYRYLFEFAPMIENEAFFAAFETICTEFALRDDPNQAYLNLGSTVDIPALCDISEQLRDTGILLDSLVTMPVNFGDSLLCIVTIEEEGEKLFTALDNYRLSGQWENTSLEPQEIAPVTISLSQKGGAADSFCTLSSYLPSRTDILGTSMSWCMDSGERLLEIAVDGEKYELLEAAVDELLNLTEQYIQNSEASLVKRIDNHWGRRGYLIPLRHNRAGSLSDLIALLLEHEVTVYSLYTVAKLLAPAHMIVGTNQPHALDDRLAS